MNAVHTKPYFERTLRILAAMVFALTSLLTAMPPAHAAGTLPLDVFDPDETEWASLRMIPGNVYGGVFDAMTAKGLMTVDLEVDVIGGNDYVGSVWQKNPDGRGWYALRNLTHAEYSAEWQAKKDAGYRVIDQETYVKDGVRYWAGVWVENKEGLAWASRRNMTGAQFTDYQNTYTADGLAPIDVEAYPYGSGFRYAAVWVAKPAGVDVVMQRDLTSNQYADLFDAMKGSYRVTDVEGYILDGQQRFAVIYTQNTNGRGWYAYRNMTSLDFMNKWNELRDAGYRLVDYEIYPTPSDGWRYAGVWRQTTDRPNWAYKQQVTDMVQAQVDAYNVPGMSVAIAFRGELVYLRGFGYADIDAGIKAHSRTSYRLASVSKAIAGILTMQLVEDNEFALGDATADYVDDLPAHQSHTIGQLASNRGGVGHYDELGGLDADYATATAASEWFWGEPLVNTPGAAYYYSTHGYTLLGAAMEGAVNQPIQNIVQDYLAGPYGLTSLHKEDLSDTSPNRAMIYDDNNNEIGFDKTGWKVLGGGLVGSAFDLARLGIKLLDGDILSQSSLDTMWTAPDGLGNYALGWSTGTEDGTRVVAKNGGQPGANSYIRIYPDKDIVVVVLSNRQGGGHSATQLGRDLGALMLDVDAATPTPIVARPILRLLPVLDPVEETQKLVVINPDLLLKEFPVDLGEVGTPPDEPEPGPMPEDGQVIDGGQDDPTPPQPVLFLPSLGR